MFRKIIAATLGLQAGAAGATESSGAFEEQMKALLPYVEQKYDLAFPMGAWDTPDQGILAMLICFGAIPRVLGPDAQMEDARILVVLEENGGCWQDKLPDEAKANFKTIQEHPQGKTEREKAMTLAKGMIQ